MTVRNHNASVRRAPDGWQWIDTDTRIRFANGEPDLVQSKANDLDRALENAEQWWGAPLQSGEWAEAEDPDLPYWEVHVEVPDHGGAA